MAKKIVLETNNIQVKGADTFEEVICLASLIASKQIDPDSTIYDMQKHFEQVLHADCGNCNIGATCLLNGMYGG